MSSGKIFISYTHRDVATARRVADAIKEAHLEVWLDETSLSPGENWIKEIDQGLSEAGYLLALLSKAALESRWVRHEWTSMLARQLSGTNGGVVIPLRLEPVDPPVVLSPIQYIDLFPDFDVGLAKLLGFLLFETRPTWLVQGEFQGKESLAALGTHRALWEAPPAQHTYSPLTWGAWHKALRHESLTEPVLNEMDNRTIRRIALRCVTRLELQSFCFDSKTPLGSLTGASINEQIMALLELLSREGRIEEFLRWLAEESPRCVEATVKAYLPNAGT